MLCLPADPAVSFLQARDIETDNLENCPICIQQLGRQVGVDGKPAAKHILQTRELVDRNEGNLFISPESINVPIQCFE